MVSSAVNLVANYIFSKLWIFKKVREQGETAVKREEIVQAERELDAVLELIQESEEISGRDDIKEERMKERNRIQEAEAEESLTRINMEDTADMLQYEACRELKRCRDVHILRPGDSLLAAFFVPVLVLVVIFCTERLFSLLGKNVFCVRICTISMRRFSLNFSIS